MSVETRFSPHTAYRLSFFLLRVPLSIGGQAAQITVLGDGHLAIGCRYPPVSITFDSLTTEVDTIVKKYGVKGVSNYWCEDVPLFELKLSSQDGFKRLLRSQERMQNELASRIAAMLAQQHRSSDPVVVTAHTEVYMLTPRPERKDARIIQVSSEKELDTCITLWRESDVFNFGALFRAFRTNRNEMTDNDEVTLAQLTKDLHEVSDWFSLGLHLGVPPAKLYDIKHDLTLRSTEEFRREMLSVWMKKSGASWPRVVTALMVIGRETLAHKIALKYGVPVPASVEKKLPQVDTSSQTSVPLQKKLIIQVEKRMREVEAKDKELAVKYQSLEEARRQMDVANQKVTETIQSIRQTQTKAINLIQEKMEVEKQLQLKEQELQFLRTIHQDSEQLENIIRNKEEEIRKLQQRLHKVESELSSERKLSQELREQLKQATVELEKKSAVEREREKATGDLRTSLERERQTVDFLREQLTSASTSKEHVECLLSTARHECESKEKEIGQHKLTISWRDEEIKSLFQQLQKQKALITKLDMESAVAREGHSSTKRELELEERILKVTNKADERRKKLEEAEEGRREAVRKMEDAQLESKLLQSQMAELREQQTKVKVCAPPPPSPPGKPTASDDDIIHNTILLKWAKPHHGGDYVECYCISYRRRQDPPDQWQTRLSDGARTALFVSGLDPKTEYCFKVYAVSDYGISNDSKVSTFETKTKVRLAEGMLSSAILIEKGPPVIYKLQLKTVVVNESNQLRRCAIGTPDPIGAPEEKVIMLLGAVGAGKTTLINGIANYLLGVEWGDDFRFKLTVDEGASQTHSQTEWITAYTFHHQKGSPLPYTLTIIDTPGFGTIGGLERDHRITAQIREFFSVPPPDGIDHLNAIGFVTRAALARLGPTQKYIFDSILTIFGKDIASNIFMMATFADGGEPPVLAALKAANIPSCDLFKFNNTSLWAKPNDKFAKLFWKMGVKSFEDFFAHLKTVETQSLRLTKEVLNEHEHLEVHAESDTGAISWSKVSYPIQTLSRPPPSQPGKPYPSRWTHDTVVLKWCKPSSGAEDIKCYTVSYYAVEDHDFPDKWMVNKTAGCTESLKVTGLKPFSVYCFQVRAESGAGCSSYSESSDPIQLHAPPPPSPPEKPTASDNDIIHNSILLKWGKPYQGGDYVKHYSISYRRRQDPPHQWQTRLSDGARTALFVSGLDPKTEYCFKVYAVSDYGISNCSKVSTFETKMKVRLAKRMLSSAILIEKGPPDIYKLQLKTVVVNESNQLRRCAIGTPDPIGPLEEKVIMLLGAVGAGKTTLINGMANYLLGVDWGDGFRFKLTVDEGASQASQAHSQTEWITAYTFHHQKGSPLPYTLTIIDTPGFGTIGGLERDHRITAQIREFFSVPPPDGIDHLNAIGFVTRAALARLTPIQKYNFDSILTIFGKDIASNIFMMATFADGGEPPVLAALKAANIPSCDLFKFNNTSLWAKPNDKFAKLFWKMGVKSFEDFFAHLKTVETQSLRLTKEVLNEHEHLETVIQGLVPQIKTVMSAMDELQQEERVLKSHEVSISANQNFKYTVRIPHIRNVDLKPGEHATLCLSCNYTCHYPCYCPVHDGQLWRCAIMNQSECMTCPGKCRWEKHVSSSYRFEAYKVLEERTSHDLLKKYETSKSGYNAVRITVDKMRQKVEHLQAKLYEMISEAQQILPRLDEIALRPNPLTELDYIDLLIESEKQESKPGYMKRMESLQEARKKAEVILQIKGEDSVYAPQWLKDAVQRAKQNVKKHIHDSQNPHVQPTLTHKAHTKAK